jgi:hypothetical protein
MTYHANPPVTNWHRQIIIGTVLGGSSLVKPARGRNCYLFMRSKHLDWMRFKSHELRIFSNGQITQEKNSYRWHSNCYPLFYELRDQLYKDGKKKVDIDLLNTIQPIALTVWFGDCGRIIRRKGVLNTHKLGEDSTEAISAFFNSAYLDNKVVKERGYLRVSFTTDATILLVKRILQINPPPCIHGKLTI